MGRAIVFNGTDLGLQTSGAGPGPGEGAAPGDRPSHSDVDPFNGDHSPAGGTFRSSPATRSSVASRRRPAAATEASPKATAPPSGRTCSRAVAAVRTGAWRLKRDRAPGGFAEYLELPPGSGVHRIRDDLPPEELTIRAAEQRVTWVRPVRVTSSSRGPRHASSCDDRRMRRGRIRSSSPGERPLPARLRRASAPTTWSTSGRERRRGAP